MNTDKETTERSQSQGSRSRRLARASIAAVVMAGTVFAGIGVASSASAATSTAAATTGFGRQQIVEAWSGQLSPFGSTGIPALTCPADTPYLVNQDLSPGRIVPRGVEVIESGFGMGVTIPEGLPTANSSYAGGTSGEAASATNWSLSDQRVLIKLHCTSEWTESYMPHH